MCVANFGVAVDMSNVNFVAWDQGLSVWPALYSKRGMPVSWGVLHLDICQVLEFIVDYDACLWWFQKDQWFTVCVGILDLCLSCNCFHIIGLFLFIEPRWCHFEENPTVVHVCVGLCVPGVAGRVLRHSGPSTGGPSPAGAAGPRGCTVQCWCVCCTTNGLLGQDSFFLNKDPLKPAIAKGQMGSRIMHLEMDAC